MLMADDSFNKAETIKHGKPILKHVEILSNHIFRCQRKASTLSSVHHANYERIMKPGRGADFDVQAQIVQNNNT